MAPQRASEQALVAATTPVASAPPAERPGVVDEHQRRNSEAVKEFKKACRAIAQQSGGVARFTIVNGSRDVEGAFPQGIFARIGDAYYCLNQKDPGTPLKIEVNHNWCRDLCRFMTEHLDNSFIIKLLIMSVAMYHTVEFFLKNFPDQASAAKGALSDLGKTTEDLQAIPSSNPAKAQLDAMAESLKEDLQKFQSQLATSEFIYTHSEHIVFLLVAIVFATSILNALKNWLDAVHKAYDSMTEGHACDTALKICCMLPPLALLLDACVYFSTGSKDIVMLTLKSDIIEERYASYKIGIDMGVLAFVMSVFVLATKGLEALNAKCSSDSGVISLVNKQRSMGALTVLRHYFESSPGRPSQEVRQGLSGAQISDVGREWMKSQAFYQAPALKHGFEPETEPAGEQQLRPAT
jgi:hypothetical protein